MSNLKSRPPVASRDKLDDFIGGAGQHPAISSLDQETTILEDFPWNDPTVRSDVVKMYNLRLPEAYFIKLKFISDHTPLSMQSFCLSELLPAIDKKIDEITSRMR